jgi:hypothetical protein
LDGERRDPLFAALAVAAKVGAGAELHVFAGERGELADAQAGLDGDEEQRMVPPSHPGVAVGRREQRVDLVSGEERHELSVGALRRDGEHPLDQRGVLGMTQRGVANSEWTAASRVLRVRTLL